MDPVPEKGTDRGEFFYLGENPFRELDEAKQPSMSEAQEEFETNDVQFKALKQDVLLEMFEPGLQDDETFPQSGNLFAIGNRTGHFVCGCPNGTPEIPAELTVGLLFGETALLREAFEDAKAKTTATLKGAYKLELPETPTHVRFAGDQQAVVVAMPSKGIAILDCNRLGQQKSLAESMISTISIPPLIDILPNPSPQHSHLVAYIARTSEGSPYGKVFLYDMDTQKEEELDKDHESTCMTFSHDGETLMVCTKSGEALYYDITNLKKSVPIRRPPPVDLPEPEGDTWWIVQGCHWIDAWNQLVIYNPLTHPSDDPLHEYQAYIISNPSHLPQPATFAYEFIKLPTPPVDAFGNTFLRPWFWFQTLHNWKPNIQDLVLCSVTAGSDIGLLGRTSEDGWRIWITEAENRRATVPYDMEKDEETIVVGMQLDFTATRKLQKPLYPDEDPLECEALPCLWVLNTKGQLAGWTMLYVPGIKAGERPVGMRSVEEQDQYWEKAKEERLTNTFTSEESNDKASWEKEWRKVFPSDDPATSPAPRTDPTPPSKPIEAITEKQIAAVSTPSQPTISAPQPSQATIVQQFQLGTTKPASGQPSQLGSTIPAFGQPSALGQPKPPFGQPPQLGTTTPPFGQPSQLGASKPAAFGQPSQLGAFGQTGQLGGSLPGQSGLYSSLVPGLNANRTGHVFGQTTGLGGFGSSTGGGFAKYTSSQSGGGGGFLSGSNPSTGSFLSGANSGGSFLSGERSGGSFLQGGQSSGSTGSFLPGATSNGSRSFLSGGSSNAFAKANSQGFEKFVAPGQSFGSAAPSSFSDGGFLASKPSTLGQTSKASPFGVAPPRASPSLSERTQSLSKPESRSQSYDLLEDESEEEDESELSESETEDEGTGVRVSTLSFGDSGFDLNLNMDEGKSPPKAAESQRPLEKTPAPVEPSTSSRSPSDEYVKVVIPSTPSPKLEKSSVGIAPEPSKGSTPGLSPLPTDREMKVPSPAITPLPNELPSHLKITPPRAEKAITPPDPVIPPKANKSGLPPQPAPQQRQVEKAPLPPDPISPQPRPVRPQPVQQISTPQKIPFPADSPKQTPSPSRKVELKQFVPIAGSMRISSKLNNNSNLSDAFKLVIEQVSKELGKLSENCNTLTEYMEYQGQRTATKTADDLSEPDDWIFADLEAMARIIEADMQTVTESTHAVPAVDETIQEIEKSLKKLEAKKLELERFVRAVKDPEVRESIYSRKLAPDFARQQKEIRHSLQDAEEKLKELASALTVLKADLADEKGSFGIHSPSTAGIYRVTNNVFSRLQLLSNKISALERRVNAKGLGLGSPAVESSRGTHSRAGSIIPTTPVNKMGVVRSSPARGSPGLRGSPNFKGSPGMRGSPLRKTMLDEKLDPWEAEEIIKEMESKREFTRKIGVLLKERQPLLTKGST